MFGTRIARLSNMDHVECRALVLEDDRAIATLLRAILAREGFISELVGKAREAIHRLSFDRYTWLFLIS